MAFIAGPYNWTFGGQSLGVVEDAPRFTARLDTIVVTGDNLGGTIQDVLHRGGNLYMDMVLQEYNAAGAPNAFWPNEPPAVSGIDDVGVTQQSWIGCARTTAQLIGTKVAGSCAYPEVWTAPQAVLAPDYDISFLMGSRLRNVPISFLLIPTVVGGTMTYIAGTNPSA